MFGLLHLLSSPFELLRQTPLRRRPATPHLYTVLMLSWESGCANEPRCNHAPFHNFRHAPPAPPRSAIGRRKPSRIQLNHTPFLSDDGAGYLAATAADPPQVLKAKLPFQDHVPRKVAPEPASGAPPLLGVLLSNPGDAGTRTWDGLAGTRDPPPPLLRGGAASAALPPPLLRPPALSARFPGGGIASTRCPGRPGLRDRHLQFR